MAAFARDGLTVTVTVTSASTRSHQPLAGSPHQNGHLPMTGVPLAALLLLAVVCLSIGAALCRLGKPTHGYR